MYVYAKSLADEADISSESNQDIGRPDVILSLRENKLQFPPWDCTPPPTDRGCRLRRGIKRVDECGDGLSVGEMTTLLRISLGSHLRRVICFRCQRSLAVVTIEVYHL